MKPAVRVVNSDLNKIICGTGHGKKQAPCKYGMLKFVRGDDKFHKGSDRLELKIRCDLQVHLKKLHVVVFDLESGLTLGTNRLKKSDDCNEYYAVVRNLPPEKSLKVVLTT